MNKVILVGRLTKDPEVRYSNSDTPVAVARYTLAVKKSYVRPNEGNADFIPVVAFGKNGEFAKDNFSKGQMVSVSGRIHQDVWEDADHNKRYRLEVIADQQKEAENASISAEESENPEHEVAVAKTQDDDLPY